MSTDRVQLEGRLASLEAQVKNLNSAVARLSNRQWYTMGLILTVLGTVIAQLLK